MSDDYTPPTVAQLLDGLAEEIASAKRHRAWLAGGSKGMNVPFHGDFAGANPSTLNQLDWWVRELRAALKRDGGTSDVL